MHIVNYILLTLQVGKNDDCYCYKSNDACTVVLTCPEALVKLFRELLLLLCGDVETNPGPTNAELTKQLDEMMRLMQDMNARTQRVEQGQNNILSSINDLKTNQEQLQLTVTNIGKTVSAIEVKAASIDELHRELAGSHQAVQRIERENDLLRTRLVEMEDQSRRDNLVFNGVDDCSGETWAQAEEKIIRLLSDSASFSISREQIVRAHRLGTFVTKRNWPIK